MTDVEKSNLKCLSRECQALLRSGVAITSLTQCVEELVLNSLDAAATCIAVRVDLATARLQCIDNGSGFTKQDLKLAAQRYTTSKCKSLEDITTNLSHYGFRGEALASMASVSAVLEIQSRAIHSSKSYSREWHAGQARDVVETSTHRPSHGTTITVYDMFHKLPVRRKQLNPNLELERIRQRMEAIALIHPWVSFSLRNDEHKQVILQTHKCKSVVATFSQLFTHSKSKHLRDFSNKLGDFEVNGYIGRQGHHNKNLQFVYVNGRLVLKSKVHRVLNWLISRSSITRRRQENSSEGSPSRTSESYGIYIVNVTCPLSQYDITFDPGKTLVEFKCWGTLLKCLQQGVIDLLLREGLKAEKSEMSPDFGAVVGEDNEAEDEKNDGDVADKPSKYGHSISTWASSSNRHSVSVRRRAESQQEEQAACLSEENDSKDNDVASPVVNLVDASPSSTQSVLVVEETEVETDNVEAEATEAKPENAEDKTPRVQHRTPHLPPLKRKVITPVSCDSTTSGDSVQKSPPLKQPMTSKPDLKSNRNTTNTISTFSYISKIEKQASKCQPSENHKYHSSLQLFRRNAQRPPPGPAVEKVAPIPSQQDVLSNFEAIKKKLSSRKNFSHDQFSAEQTNKDYLPHNKPPQSVTKLFTFDSDGTAPSSHGITENQQVSHVEGKPQTASEKFILQPVHLKEVPYFVPQTSGEVAEDSVYSKHDNSSPKPQRQNSGSHDTVAVVTTRSDLFQDASANFRLELPTDRSVPSTDESLNLYSHTKKRRTSAGRPELASKLARLSGLQAQQGREFLSTSSLIQTMHDVRFDDSRNLLSNRSRPLVQNENVTHVSQSKQVFGYDRHDLDRFEQLHEQLSPIPSTCRRKMPSVVHFSGERQHQKQDILLDAHCATELQKSNCNTSISAKKHVSIFLENPFKKMKRNTLTRHTEDIQESIVRKQETEQSCHEKNSKDYQNVCYDNCDIHRKAGTALVSSSLTRAADPVVTCLGLTASDGQQVSSVDKTLQDAEVPSFVLQAHCTLGSEHCTVGSQGFMNYTKHVGTQGFAAQVTDDSDDSSDPVVTADLSHNVESSQYVNISSNSRPSDSVDSTVSGNSGDPDDDGESLPVCDNTSGKASSWPHTDHSSFLSYFGTQIMDSGRNMSSGNSLTEVSVDGWHAGHCLAISLRDTGLHQENMHGTAKENLDNTGGKHVGHCLKMSLSDTGLHQENMHGTAKENLDNTGGKHVGHCLKMSLSDTGLHQENRYGTAKEELDNTETVSELNYSTDVHATSLQDDTADNDNCFQFLDACDVKQESYDVTISTGDAAVIAGLITQTSDVVSMAGAMCEEDAETMGSNIALSQTGDDVSGSDKAIPERGLNIGGVITKPDKDFAGLLTDKISGTHNVTKGTKDASSTQDTIETQDTSSTQDTIGTQDASSTQDTIGTQDASSTQDTIGIQDASSTQDTIGTQDASSTQDTIGTQDASSTQDTIGTQDASSIQDTTGTKDIISKASDVMDTQDVMISSNYKTATNEVITSTLGNVATGTSYPVMQKDDITSSGDLITGTDEVRADRDSADVLTCEGDLVGSLQECRDMTYSRPLDTNSETSSAEPADLFDDDVSDTELLKLSSQVPQEANEDKHIVFAGPSFICKTDPVTGRKVFVNRITGCSAYEEPTDKAVTQQNLSAIVTGTNTQKLLSSGGLVFLQQARQQKGQQDLAGCVSGALQLVVDSHLDSLEMEAGAVKWRDGHAPHESGETGSCDILGPSLDPGKPSQCESRLQYSRHPSQITKAMLSTINVLGQVDNKFIACLMKKQHGTAQGQDGDHNDLDSLLIVIDQHAAHERVRLEQLTQEAYEDNKRDLKCSKVEPPLGLELQPEDVRLMLVFRGHLATIGIEFEHDRRDKTTVNVTHVPQCFVEEGTSQLKQGRASVTASVIQLLQATNGACAAMPPEVHHLLCLQACHGAVKFGDKLSMRECELLVESLCECKLPFQCAHGRPSIMPLLDLRQLSTVSVPPQKLKPCLQKLKLQILEEESASS